MKRILAILALMSVVLVLPMSVLADDVPGGSDQEQSQVIEMPNAPHQPDEIEQDAQDTNGDPHELGGGFRGTSSPCGTVPIPPIWIGPVATLIMHLV